MKTGIKLLYWYNVNKNKPDKINLIKKIFELIFWNACKKKTERKRLKKQNKMPLKKKPLNYNIIKTTKK